MAMEAEAPLAIEACYDAVFEPARWPEALQELAESLDATSCVVRAREADDTPLNLQALESTEHAGFSELWLERIEGAPDPHIDRSLRLHKPGVSFIVEDEISTPEERATLPYYQEIARPGHREWWAAVCFEANHRAWCLPLYREEKKGPFDPHDARLFLKAASHLSRIISAAEKLLDTSASPSLTALDRLGTAAVLLDRRGCVRRVNERADALLGPNLKVRHGRICAADQTSDSRLQKLVAAIVSSPFGSSITADPIVIARSEKPWLLVEAMPITPFGNDVFDVGHALLFFTDLAAPSAPSGTLLGAVFQLTPAEARLAVCLAAGSGISSASAMLGISRETARSQLRAVFAKTDTHRQAELTALLSRLRGSS
jgi:DNA-binding CsgD family transcriptional regulator